MTRCSICPSVSTVFRGVAATLEQRTPSFGQVVPFAQFEGVVIGDYDFRALEIREHVSRDQLPTLVIAVRIVRLQYAEPISDGQARRDDQEATSEPLCFADGGRHWRSARRSALP